MVPPNNDYVLISRALKYDPVQQNMWLSSHSKEKTHPGLSRWVLHAIMFMTGKLFPGRQKWRDTSRQEMSRLRTPRDWGNPSTNQGTLGVPEAWCGRKGHSAIAFGGSAAARPTPWFRTFGFYNNERINFYRFKSPSWW